MYCVKNSKGEYYTGGGAGYPGTGAAKRDLWTPYKEYACGFNSLEHAQEVAKRYGKSCKALLHEDYLARSGRPVELILEKIRLHLNEQEIKFLKDSFIEGTLNKEIMKFYLKDK